MRNLPVQVSAAIMREDTFALKLMGRKGGRTTQRRRDVQKAINAFYKERAQLELYRRAVEAHEDLAPVDDTPMGQIFFHADE